MFKVWKIKQFFRYLVYFVADQIAENEQLKNEYLRSLDGRSIKRNISQASDR